VRICSLTIGRELGCANPLGAPAGWEVFSGILTPACHMTMAKSNSDADLAASLAPCGLA